MGRARGGYHQARGRPVQRAVRCGCARSEARRDPTHYSCVQAGKHDSGSAKPQATQAPK